MGGGGRFGRVENIKEIQEVPENEEGRVGSILSPFGSVLLPAERRRQALSMTLIFMST